MTEQRHQRLQRHAGVDQVGRVGVAQLMGGWVQGFPVGAGEAGGCGGLVESAAEPVGGQPPAAFDE